jgi:hypothetical protein
MEVREPRDLVVLQEDLHYARAVHYERLSTAAAWLTSTNLSTQEGSWVRARLGPHENKWELPLRSGISR